MYGKIMDRYGEKGSELTYEEVLMLMIDDLWNDMTTDRLHFNVKGVIGKGGMGPKTLAACAEVPGVYFHAIGGAATLIAQSVKKVLDVHKMEFGVPEAIWVLEVEDFPVVVTMDSHGNSIHSEIEEKSKAVFEKLVA